MVIFLGAETMFFAGLITAFLSFRLGSPAWPPVGQPHLPIGVTAVNTAVLLLSAYPMLRAWLAVRRGDRRGLVRGLGATALLGATFLGVQGYEWARLLHFGLTLSAGTYGATFYTLIGCHGVHVLGAMVWVLLVLIGAMGNRFSAQRHLAVQLCGMYWSFVVGLWPILFVLVYLT
jgi:cytochrome c oxidase subunit 3